VTHLVEALRAGTPNRNRIALQMVKDLLDESSFDAGPGAKVPSAVGSVAQRLVGRLRDQDDDGQP
jgi:pyruvate dehydrogenase (quinone)/pyruvate oxidase